MDNYPKITDHFQRVAATSKEDGNYLLGSNGKEEEVNVSCGTASQSLRFTAPTNFAEHPVRPPGSGSNPPAPPMLPQYFSEQCGRYGMSYHTEDYLRFRLDEEETVLDETAVHGDNPAVNINHVPTLQWWFFGGGRKIKGHVLGPYGTKPVRFKGEDESTWASRPANSVDGMACRTTPRTT